METAIRHPRVLVTTVGAWSSRVGSDTMSSLMQRYGAENVAALYIRADKSDSRSASRYFHIIEGRVMRSILHPSTVTGEEFRPEDVEVTQTSADEDAESARYGRFSRHRWGGFLFARELVWKLGRWKSAELDAFLDDFKPEVLICPIESYIHFNTINEYIARRCGTRVIGFLWDDNFTYKQVPYNFWHQIHRVWLRRSVRRMVDNCSTVFCLSPKMKEECDKEFGIESRLLTKPIFNQGDFKEYEVGRPVRILYSGNLFIGRDKTMLLIADALREFNRDGVRIVLDIYTKTALDPKDLARIEVDGICRMHGAVPQDEVFALQENADVLLFVESLDRNRHQDARLSFSTKITDYFRAGKCIWTVGSPTLGPVDYLTRMDASLVSTDRQSISAALQRLADDSDVVLQYARKGFDCGRKYHDGDRILDTLYHTIETI